MNRVQMPQRATVNESWKLDRVSKFKTHALRGTAIEIDVRPDSRILVLPHDRQVF